MKRMKLATIITVMFSFLWSMSCYADNRSGDYQYKTNSDGTITITKYLGNDSVVTVPETIAGYTVSVIGNNAFYDSGIEEINMPESIKQIEKYAFAFSENLVSVNTFATEIGKDAFEYCSDLETIVFHTEDPIDVDDSSFYSCESLVLFDGIVNKMGEYSFGFCESLEAITLSGDRIPKNAFTYCSSLETVSFTSEDAEVIVEDSAFYSCEGLTTFGAVIKELGTYSFGFCEDLQEITFAGDKVPENAFTYCSSLGTVHFMQDKTTICESAFYSCEKLKTVEGTVTDVEEYAFGFCEKLEAITVSGEEIADNAFTYCEKLKEVNLLTPKAVIGDSAFYSCDKLETVNGIVGDTGEYGFGFCKNLKRLRFAGTEIGDDAFTFCDKLVVEVPDVPEIQQAIKAAKVHYLIGDFSDLEEQNEESSDPAEPETNITSDSTWVCPECGNNASDNFCNNCGSPRPDNITLPDDTVKSSVNYQSEEPSTVEQLKDNASEEVSLESIFGYIISPKEEISVVSVIDMGDSYSILMSDGESFNGWTEHDPGLYIIKCASTKFSMNFTSDNSAYNYEDQGFIDVLNYLLSKKGRKIVSVIPTFGSMYSAIDDAGDTYTVNTVYSKQLKMIDITESED